MKDKVVLGLTIGLFADLVKLMTNYIGHLLKFTDVLFWQIAATRFLEKSDLNKPVAYLVGGFADLAVAALMGVIFIYLLYFTGRDYAYIKGVGFGIIVWVALFGTVLGQSVQNKLTLNSTAILVTAIAHLSFGAALAFFALKFSSNKSDTCF